MKKKESKSSIFNCISNNESTVLIKEGYLNEEKG